MPSITCRDVDESCDWFFRDADPARLLVEAVHHTEEQHLEYLEKIKKEMPLSVALEHRIKAFRPD